MQNRKSILRVVTVGLFAALVFAGNYLSFPIPVAVGNVTRIHLGNVLCLLAGFIAGPIGGGLASGIGGALYDMMNPAYIADAPFTFLFKFLLAFVCGLAAHGGKLTGGIPNTAEVKIPRRIAAGVLGSVTYIVLYIGKNFIEALLLGGGGARAGDAARDEHGQRGACRGALRTALRRALQGTQEPEAL